MATPQWIHETLDVPKMIEAALRRNAHVGPGLVQVEVRGQTVTLPGDVRSWAEREEAERAAWNAPGLANLENRITVRPEMPHA
jgi:osmotically-inducible protein OsmY